MDHTTRRPLLRETPLPLLLVAVTMAVSIMAAGLLVIDAADRSAPATAVTAPDATHVADAKNL